MLTFVRAVDAVCWINSVRAVGAVRVFTARYDRVVGAVHLISYLGMLCAVRPVCVRTACCVRSVQCVGSARV